LLLADIEKMKYWEKKFWKKATQLVAVSEADKEVMKQDATVVANGVNLQQFKYIPSEKKFGTKEKRILFMGDFKWVQNIEAVNFILDTIWPEIESRIKNQELRKGLKLWIVGKHIPEDIKAYQGGSIIIDENAPDATEKIYQKSFALLAPIRVGGGSSYKILESMASGVVVVTTPLGVNGLGAVADKHALVAETAEGLAGHIETLLENKKDYEKLTQNARKLIEEKYSWESITKVLENVYEEAVKND
jgi:glycosyltransferase involved in cell wall biosynthesis